MKLKRAKQKKHKNLLLEDLKKRRADIKELKKKLIKRKKDQYQFPVKI